MGLEGVPKSFVAAVLIAVVYPAGHLIEAKLFGGWFVCAPLGLVLIWLGLNYPMPKVSQRWVPLWGVASWGFFGWFLLLWPGIVTLLDWLF